MLQEFLFELKSGHYEFVKIQKKCEKIRKEMKLKPDMLPALAIKIQIQRLIEREEWAEGYILSQVLERAFSNFGGATCSLKAVGIAAGGFGAFALGMGRYTCKTSLGIKSSFIGPRLGAGVLGGVVFGISKASFSIPIPDVFKAFSSKQNSCELYKAFIAGTSDIYSQEFCDERTKGYYLGLGYGGIDNHMFAVRTGEPILDVSEFYRQAFNLKADW